MTRIGVAVLALVATAAAMAGIPAAAAPAAPGPPARPATYRNPVSTPGAVSFPDPSVIHAKDGFWYAFGTSDPIHPDGPAPRIPILRSADLVHWKRIGQVFPDSRPGWITAESDLWAPDIRFINGHYVLYYVATDTVAIPGTDDSAIGVATAPSPAGPWTDSGRPLVAPRPGNGSYLGTIDPAGFTDRQGRNWLYWSSFNGGGFVTRLSADGRHTVGAPKQVLIDNRYEGIYVISHEGWYYVFASSTDCCSGPLSGYTVFAGRSRSPEGPFVDADGISLNTSRVGGTQVIAPSGNRWVGTGHNAVLTDDAGQDWFAYHAIPRANPYLQQDISRRPMLIDRLDWIDGWPTVRAGEGASDTPQPAPVTAGALDDSFSVAAAPSAAGPDPLRWQVISGRWVRRSGTTAGGYLRQRAAAGGILLSRRAVPAQSSTLLDVRLTRPGTAAGFTVRYVDARTLVAVEVDRARRALVVDVVVDGRHRRTSSALPADYRYGIWHVVAAQVRAGRVVASVSADDLHDPVATVAAALPRSGPLSGAAAGMFALLTTGRVAVDNVAVSHLYQPISQPAPLPRASGAPLAGYSTDFGGTGIPRGWTWLRKDPAAHVAGGALVWPVEDGDLNNDPADAGILLHAAPKTDWVAEVRLTLPLGTDTVENFQQAGIAAYVDDDDVARLDTVAIWDTRQIEFNRKRLVDGAPASSGTVLGHSADTVWLRLYAYRDRSGAWRVRSASSVDGRRFDFGGTWVFAAGAVPRIGLVSLGNTDKTVPVATARFDSVRVWRLATPVTEGFPD